ncbi:MAG: hypothetical protein ACE366_27395 [Bradymonadia bacterium]
MAQVYILRRDGRDYQAPDLETLRRWAQDGRVLPTDMVYSPVYQSWYRAHDLRGLRDVLPRVEQPQPVASSATQQFWLRKGDKNYPADSLETVLKWASAGNINPDDLIFHPAYGKWFRAGDSPQLVSRFPAQQRAASSGAWAGQSLGATAELAAKSFGAEVGAPSAPAKPAEGSDSIAETVMELNVVTPGPTGGAVAADDLKAPSAPAEAPAAPEAPSPPTAAAEPPSAPDETPQSESQNKPQAAPEPAPSEAPEAPAAEEVSDEAGAPEFEGEPPRYVDRKGLMKPFYHVARAFVMTRDMRPGETLEGSCVLPGTERDFKGEEKRPIYDALSAYVLEHLDGALESARAEHSKEEMPAFEALVSRGQALHAALVAASTAIGASVPERVVIGNSNRPKMSPDENASMMEIDQRLKGVISLKARAAGAAA